jgi:hypothetical protein
LVDTTDHLCQPQSLPGLSDNVRPRQAILVGNPKDAVVASRLRQKTSEISDTALVRLRRIPAPAGDKPELATIWDAKAAALRTDAHANLVTHPLAGMNAGAAYDRLAHKYGFKVCGT